MSVTRGGVLSVVDRVPLAWLPAQYQKPMRDYLGQGILPEPHVQQLLEGSISAVLGFGHDLFGLLELATWVQRWLPPEAWGSRDQVQLWVVYVRRARGRALLSTFDDGGSDGQDASAAAGLE